jgi:hypothetical protein
VELKDVDIRMRKAGKAIFMAHCELHRIALSQECEVRPLRLQATVIAGRSGN